MNNRELVESWYDALAQSDIDAFLAVQRDDVVYNVSGHTPISGRFFGKDRLVSDILPRVLGNLDMSDFAFCVRCRIVCADDRRVVAIMEADGKGSNGLRYDQRYCHMFAFADGLISEVWEFFDTALADRVLFDNDSEPLKPDQAFDF